MRGILALLFAGLVVLLSPIFVFLLSLRLSGITASLMKERLAGANTYTILVEELNKAVDGAVQQDESGDLRQFAPVIKKEITPGLVKTKVDKLLDDTENWITGKSQTVPSISFLEFKDMVIAQNPGLAREMGLLTQKQQSEVPVAAEYDYGVPHPNANAVFDRAVNRKLTISLGSVLGIVKPLYQLTWMVFYGITIVLIISMVIIFLLAPNRSSGIRRIGVVCFLIVLWNGVPFLLLASPAFLISFLTSSLAAEMGAGAAFALLVPILVTPVLSQIVMQQTVILGMLFVASIILGISSLFFKTKEG